MTARTAALFFVLLALGCGKKAISNQPRSSKNEQHFGRASVELNAERWLRSVTARAKKAGASNAEIVAVEAGAPGDRVSGLLDAPEGDCVIILARASQSIEDIDLFVYGDDGTVFGSDEGQDKTPSLLVCPPHPPRLYLSARVAQGHGLVVLGAQRVPREDAEEVAKVVGASNRPGETSRRVDAWPGLEETINVHRQLIGASWRDVRRVALPLDARMQMRVSASISENSCLDALVIPSEEVSHLDVSVLDHDGRIVGRAAASGSARSLIVCSTTQAPITFQVRPHAGRGLAALILSRSIPGSERDLDPLAPRVDLTSNRPLSEREARLRKKLEHLGYSSAEKGGQGSLSVGTRTSLTVSLRPGCTRIDALGGPPVSGMAAWLWSEQGDLLAHDRGNGELSLFACAKMSKARLDLEALSRPGPFSVQLHREKDVPPVLLRHPLAASRLLSRMTSTGVLRTAGQLGAADAVKLDSTRLYRMDVLVPVGRCFDISLALGAGAVGAEIRAVEQGTNTELGLSRGTYSTSLRLCGFDRRGTVHATAEFRANSGPATALVATRMLSPKE